MVEGAPEPLGVEFEITVDAIADIRLIAELICECLVFVERHVGAIVSEFGAIVIHFPPRGLRISAP